jgi:hypothetical protein
MIRGKVGHKFQYSFHPSLTDRSIDASEPPPPSSNSTGGVVVAIAVVLSLLVYICD